MNHVRMDSLTERLQAIVAPKRGGGGADDMELPRTRQDLALEETGRRAQASVSIPRLPPINTSIPAIRKDTLGSPLSGGTLFGDELDEPHEKEKEDGNVQESKSELPVVDSPDQEMEWPLKFPKAPQLCRRWEKPESYAVFNFSCEGF